ncbi:hypothetical protein [Elioraea sp.]|uniref:hypothetical protein n=1 Tax=Elioraea sp. TaxID=2185103 RepID=UPI0025C12507|nr:hypothetical protein [Elioraea sp.]
MIASAASAQPTGGGMMIDPAFRTPAPQPRSDLDLAPPLPMPPPGVVETTRRSLFGTTTIAPSMLERLDAHDPHRLLRDDLGTRLQTGERLEDPLPADRLGATLTFPF